MEFNGEQQMKPNKFSLERIENRMVNLTYESLSFEDCFETKLRAKFDKYDQNFEHPEEELMGFIEQWHQESEQIEEKLVNLNSKTP